MSIYSILLPENKNDKIINEMILKQVPLLFKIMYRSLISKKLPQYMFTLLFL